MIDIGGCYSGVLSIGLGWGLGCSAFPRPWTSSNGYRGLHLKLAGCDNNCLDWQSEMCPVRSREGLCRRGWEMRNGVGYGQNWISKRTDRATREGGRPKMSGNWECDPMPSRKDIRSPRHPCRSSMHLIVSPGPQGDEGSIPTPSSFTPRPFATG